MVAICNVRVAVRGKKRKSRSDVFKQRFRKNFSALLEEEVRTSSSAVAKRPRDASCLSVVSFKMSSRVLYC